MAAKPLRTTISPTGSGQARHIPPPDPRQAWRTGLRSATACVATDILRITYAEPTERRCLTYPPKSPICHKSDGPLPREQPFP